MQSRFLRALPPALIEEKHTSSLWAPGPQQYGQYGQRRGGWQNRWREQPPAGPPARLPAEEESQAVPRFVKGERVRHRRFGSGTIEGLIGAGKDLKVSVRFDAAEVGVKQLLVAYAGLEREWEEGA